MKYCKNQACSMRNTKINTDFKNCLSCDRELVDQIADLMDFLKTSNGPSFFG